MTVRIKNLVVRASGIGKSEAAEIGRGLTRHLTTKKARELADSGKVTIRVEGKAGKEINAKAVTKAFRKRI